MPTGYQGKTLLQRHSEPRLRLEGRSGTEPTQGPRWVTASITQPVLYPRYLARTHRGAGDAIARPASRQAPMPVSRKRRCPDGTYEGWRRLGGPASVATPTPPGTPTPATRKRQCSMAPDSPRGDAGIESRWLAASIAQPALYPSYPASAQDELRNVIARRRRPAAGGGSVIETWSGGYVVGDRAFVSLWTQIYGGGPVAWNGGWAGTCGGEYGLVNEAGVSGGDRVTLETGHWNWVEDPVAIGTMDLEHLLQ
ncbi:hypothetical protein HOY82DRAFT_618752 [Tuber indicum]|nr:hypothetical protein HOY82DRAFT_618752 [Tuber indicum]